MKDIYMYYLMPSTSYSLSVKEYETFFLTHRKKEEEEGDGDEANHPAIDCFCIRDGHCRVDG